MKRIYVLMFSLMIVSGYSQNWKTSLEEAKSFAIKENKNILIVFSGSDWCAPCMKLDKTVWKSKIFKDESEEKWILIKADFPKKKANQLDSELAESNKKLAEKFNKGGNFPLVVLLDKNEKVLGMSGFKNVSAEEYVKIIKAFEKNE